MLLNVTGVLESQKSPALNRILRCPPIWYLHKMNIIIVNLYAKVEPACGWVPAKLGNFRLLVNTKGKFGGGLQVLQVSSLQRGQFTLSPTLWACPHISAEKELTVYMWYWGQNLKQIPGQTEWIKYFPKLEEIHISLCYYGVKKKSVSFWKPSFMSLLRWWWEGGWRSHSLKKNISKHPKYLNKMWQCEERVGYVEMYLGWLKGWGFISCDGYPLKGNCSGIFFCQWSEIICRK